MPMDQAIYWIWLQNAIGVGQPQSEELLREFAHAEDIYNTDDLSRLTTLTAEQRQKLRRKDLSKALAEYKALQTLGGWVLTPQCAAYDSLFGGMYAPPLAIYGKGATLEDLDAPVVAVVGTRRCDETGVLVTRRLAAGLAAGGAVVVTGGAKGLDSEAMKATLDEGGRCISFQACGIDVDYPKAVSPLRQALLQYGGTLLSEFPLGKPAMRHHFRIRNRLISAAARGTLVTQAPRGSGAVITATWARDQGRDVFAAPGAVGVPCNEGSNDLLKDGAKPVTNAADILMEYIDRYPLVIDIQAAVAAEERAAAKYRQELADRKNGAPARAAVKIESPKVPVLKVAQPDKAVKVVPCPDGVSGDMKRIYDALTVGRRAASELARELDMPAATVLSSLTMMELRGIVTCEAGQRYALKTIDS